jgi:hypothetical protein
MKHALQTLAAFLRELRRELARLNSAGLGRKRLSQLPRAARSRAVKDALARMHSDSPRCC